MNKIYILVPLIGMLLFGGYYVKFDNGYAEAQRIKNELKNADIKAKKEQDLKNREIAYQDAIKAAAERKKQRDEKEAVEADKKEARLQADELRYLTNDERKLAHEQVDLLKKEVAAIQTEVTKYEKEKDDLSKELAAQKQYVQKAEANQKYYYDLLDKIAAADKARAEADAAAALAKKTS